MDDTDRKPPDPGCEMAEGLKDVSIEGDLPSDGMISGMDITCEPTSSTQQQPQTQTGPHGSYPYQGQVPGQGQCQDSGQLTSTQQHGHTGQQVPPYHHHGQNWQGPGQGQPGYPYPYPQQGGENPYPRVPHYHPRFGYYDYRYGGYIHPQTAAFFRCPDPHVQLQYPQTDESQQQNQGVETSGQTGPQPTSSRSQRTQNDPNYTTSQPHYTAGGELPPRPHPAASHPEHPVAPFYSGQVHPPEYSLYPSELPPPYDAQVGSRLKLEQDQHEAEKKCRITDAVCAAIPETDGGEATQVGDGAMGMSRHTQQTEETTDHANSPEETFVHDPVSKETPGETWMHDQEVTDITPSHKVEVRGLPATITHDSISLYFENRRRSDGGPVDNVVKREDGTAVVEFEHAEDAERVLKKATHAISGTVIQVTRYTSESRQSEVSTLCDDAPAMLPDTIIVTGCEEICDDVLEMYFENKKKSWGGDVKSIERRGEGGSEVVLVTFEDPEDAKRVLKKGSHNVQQRDVKVAVYKPRPPTPQPVVSADTIVVTGYGDISDDVLEMYFESKKKSGGGDVKSIERSEEGGSEVVLVTFEDPEDAKRVLKKGSHNVQQRDVKVAVYKPRPPTPPPVVSADTIVVTGYGAISDDVLEMYFESKKKSGGGDVKSTERRQEGGSEVVLVTFEDPEDMQAVLQRSHQLHGMSLQVSPHTVPSRSSHRHTHTEDSYLSAEDEDQNDGDDEYVFVLLVEGLSDSLGKETLLYYFENRRRSGGGEVDELEIDRDSATALVHFKEGNVVKRVLQKAPHLLEDKKIEVSEYLPSKQPGLVTIETVLKGKKEGTVVKVEKFGSKTSDDVLIMYFENKKRSGASEVKEIIPDKEENAKYIVFESPEEAEAVAKRTHTVDGHKLLVNLYRPPTPPPPRPRYRDKFLITGLREKTTKQTLMNFLKHKLACHPKGLRYGEEPGTVLVNIDLQKGPLKLKTMQRVCKKHPLDWAFLELSSVPISNCIRVDGITAKTSTDTLTFYFESKKSGNTIECDVEKVDIVEEPRHAIVFFTNHTVIPEILSRSHKLEKVALSLSLYTECLGSGGGQSDPTWFKLPQPITVRTADSYKVKFIRDSSLNLKNLQKQMQDGYTDLKFESDGSVTLECCLTKDVPDARKLSKSWHKDATEDLEHFLSLLITEKVNVLQEVWSDVITEIQKMKIPRPEAATFYVFDESHLIVVVGHKLLAENLSKHVKEVVATVEGDHERKKKEITESVANLKSWQLRLLQALGFPNDMMTKYEHLRVEICCNKNVMTLTGLMSVVKSAKVDMYETMNNFKDTSLSNLSDAQMMLVQKEDMRNYILKKLNLKHLVGVWEAENGKLKVYGRTDSEVTHVSHIVRESVIQQLINLDPESVPLLDSPEWRRIYDEQTQNRGDTVKIVIAVDKSHIVIAATDELIAGVAEEVNNFLKENTVYSNTVQFPKGIQRFMTMHLDGEIRELSNKFQVHSVHIIFQKFSQDFTVKGTKVGLRICMSKLEEISQRVVHISHLFGKPGICKLIQSEKGNQHIRYIEENGRCVIEKNFDSQAQPIYGKGGEERNMRSGRGIQTLAKCDLGAGRTLTVCQGDITQMKVDVIVNAANQQLAHVGGLAKAIVDKGGLSIQVESDKIRQSQGDIGVGEVAVTNPGKLPCKLVVHAVGPIWSGGTNDEQGLLQEAIFNSLEKTDSCGLSSIAIPALSTGIYRYPVAEATKTIIEAIQLHFRDTPGSQVMNVYVCDNNASTVGDFMQAVKQRFPAGAVTIGNRDGSVEDGVVEDRHVPVNRGRQRKGPRSSQHDPSPSHGRPEQKMSRIRIKVVPGEIARERVDVIVNTTSSSLDLNKGAVSASILETGGVTIQMECTAKYPDGIHSGQIAITGAGSLMCKSIFHTCLPSWPRDQNGEMSLQVLVANCLAKASDKQYRSIAFPALGTGNLGYPRDVVAKTMMETVEQFGQLNPETSLQEVKIVVYHKDSATIKAFEYQQGKDIGSTGVPSQKRRHWKNRQFGDEPQGAPAGSSEDGEWQHISTSDLAQVYQLGKVQLTLKQGDLLKEKTSCIVNSTNSELNLTMGAVAKSILSKGGRQLEAELELKKAEMKKRGIVTTTAGGLKAAFIIHVSGDHFTGDWKKGITKCLEEAGTLTNVSSIAFPALGTGQGNRTPEEMATCLIGAVNSYQSSAPKHGMITDIRMVIFQKDMLDPFAAGVNKALKSKKKGYFRKAMDYVFGESTEKTEHVAQPTEQAVNDITLHFFSDSKEDIDKAKSMLENEYQNSTLTKAIMDEVLKTLTKQQEANIRGLGSKFSISVDYNRSTGRVKLQGLTNDVISAMDAVHKIIQEALRQEQQSEKAEMLSSYVQWSFIDVDSTGSSQPVEYEKILNQQIEEAYQNKKPFICLPPDTDGNTYVVDLNNMEEYNSDNPNDKVPVIRKDLIKGASFEPPSNWTQMTTESEMVPVNSTTQEYTDVKQRFLKTLRTTPNILKIERVQTKFLWQQYVAKKHQLDSQNPGHPNETVLWHGTAVDAIPSICKSGFNRSYCGKNATALGDGVYFAVQASYSNSNTYSVPDIQGHKHMFQARVLTGMYCQGIRGMRVPPPRDASRYIHYDSVVDNVNQPGMYIIFNDTQAYPEYLITYQ
ncbi:protein mono-ADP-ribosyltransferase PARP14-like [Haliotis asinina]|uniref:protein mono-ADP-ribosyltransferase PARP14-like n=1 Tax=Haliotis asinina TaxID=109174 RepID=UPI003531D886